MLKPMISKALPKIRESINQKPLNPENGEFARMIMIEIGQDQEGKDLPLEFHVVTLGTEIVTNEEGKALPTITEITQLEGL